MQPQVHTIDYRRRIYALSAFLTASIACVVYGITTLTRDPGDGQFTDEELITFSMVSALLSGTTLRLLAYHCARHGAIVEPATINNIDNCPVLKRIQKLVKEALVQKANPNFNQDDKEKNIKVGRAGLATLVQTAIDDTITNDDKSKLLECVKATKNLSNEQAIDQLVKTACEYAKTNPQDDNKCSIQDFVVQIHNSIIETVQSTTEQKQKRETDVHLDDGIMIAKERNQERMMSKSFHEEEERKSNDDNVVNSKPFYAKGSMILLPLYEDAERTSNLEKKIQAHTLDTQTMHAKQQPTSDIKR